MSSVLRPMWAEENEDYVIGYMCLTDFECEIGAANGGNTIYPSVEDIRERRKCVETCGIIEVEVRARRIVQEAREDE